MIFCQDGNLLGKNFKKILILIKITQITKILRIIIMKHQTHTEAINQRSKEKRTNTQLFGDIDK